MLAVATHEKVVRDSSGVPWTPARGFVGGRKWQTKPGTKIAKTKDDVLYRTERAGMSRFNQPVADGTYKVTLRLAEIYWNSAGKRVFDVKAEGQRVLDDVDIFAAVGKNAAYNKSFKVNVSDGDLNLAFSSTASVAKVSALQIQRLDWPRRGDRRPKPSPTPTAAPTTKAPTAAPTTAAPTTAAPTTKAPTVAPTTAAPTTKAPTAAPTTAAPTTAAPTTAAPTTAAPTTAAPTTAAPTTAPPTYPAASYPAPGTVKPGASNTGVPAGTVLTPRYGNLTINTPGATYDKVEFFGNVIITAADVKITRSKFRGQPTAPTAQIGLVRCMAGCLRVVIEDSEFAPTTPSWAWNGITGHNFTVRRSNFHDVVDAIETYDSQIGGATSDLNIYVESNWMHDLSYFSPSPDGDNRTHNDCVQIQGGRNQWFVGNNMQCYLSNTSGTVSPTVPRRSGNQGNAVFMIKPDVADIQGIHILKNWLGGGDYAINIANRASGPTRTLGNIGEISNNRFDRGAYGGRQLSMPSNVTCVTTGNVFDDTGAAITVYRNG